jgi:hypothetical protein
MPWMLYIKNFDLMEVLDFMEDGATADYVLEEVEFQIGRKI